MPYKQFKSALIDRLSRDLPSIAICSYSFGGDPYALYADYVGRKLPLVAIDSRPPPSKSDVDVFKRSRLASGTPLQVTSLAQTGAIVYDEASQVKTIADSIFEEVKWYLLTVVEPQLNASGTWNFHDASIISFMHSKIREFCEARAQLASQVNGTVALTKKQWLFMAVNEKLKAVEADGHMQ